MFFRNAKHHLILYSIVGFTAVFLIWASFAKISESVVATGQIVASAQTQNIQSLDGGIIKKVFVHEGDIVGVNQALMKLDDVRYSSSYEENKVKYYSLQASLVRLNAEERGLDNVSFPAELIKNYPELVQSETNLFYANRKELRATLGSLKQNVDIVKSQYENFNKLEAEQIIPKLELIKVKKELNDITGKYSFEVNSYYSKVKDDISKTKTEFESLKEVLFGYKDRYDRTLLTSPVYGVVKKINFNTIGSIIKSGDTIMEIVPLGGELLVEGKILPNKIAFINPTQPVNISISAYDSSIYGILKGSIKYISADTIVETEQNGTKQSYYKVVVKSRENSIKYKGRSLSIIPGMQASVNIITGERTVLQYILKPLIKTKLNAFNER